MRAFHGSSRPHPSSTNSAKTKELRSLCGALIIQIIETFRVETTGARV
jgi:hypothetical protein